MMAVDTANRNKSANILTPFLVLDFLRLTYNGDNQHAPKGVFYMQFSRYVETINSVSPFIVVVKKICKHLFSQAVCLRCSLNCIYSSTL